jgi:hypothetical protein
VAREAESESEVPVKPVTETSEAKGPQTVEKTPQTPGDRGGGLKRPDRSKGRRKPVDLMADTTEVDLAKAASPGGSAASDEAGQPSPVRQPAESGAAKDAAFAVMPATSTAMDLKKPSQTAGVEAEIPAVERAKEGQIEKNEAGSAPPPMRARERAVPPARAPQAEAVGAAPPVAPPRPQNPPAPPPVGIVHPLAKRMTVYYLAAGLAGVAVVSVFPAVREVLLHFASENSPGIDLWAPIVILIAMIQLAYVVYVVQLPDWGSTRVLMVLSVIVAMFYAMVLGMSVMAQDDNPFVLCLGLTNEYALSQIKAWCFLMLALMCTLAYFWARTTFLWHRDNRQAAAGPG